ncbi:hypothetical protein ACFFHM_23590 [Halalkalibacter kiskunsagensis]|uniref:Lipoprotein n=1 Tax=Halalkalibacter kiskunsagensis TaxID=1548599 RepID=A0ABV6KJA7_9BACI
MNMRKWSAVLLCTLFLTACESLTTTGLTKQKPLNEVTLSENEQVIFSLLADRIFYLDFKDSKKEFRSIEVGVDYYHYGELVEKNGGMIMGANDPEMELEEKRARFLFTMNTQEGDENISVYGNLNVIYNSGSSGSTSYSFEREGTARGSSSWGYLVDQIDEITYDEKNYVAYYIENVESNTMRSFDSEVAVTPNQEYEHVYMYYVAISDKPL